MNLKWVLYTWAIGIGEIGLFSYLFHQWANPLILLFMTFTGLTVKWSITAEFGED